MAFFHFDFFFFLDLLAALPLLSPLSSSSKEMVVGFWLAGSIFAMYLSFAAVVRWRREGRAGKCEGSGYEAEVRGKGSGRRGHAMMINEAKRRSGREGRERALCMAKAEPRLLCKRKGEGEKRRQRTGGEWRAEGGNAGGEKVKGERSWRESNLSRLVLSAYHRKKCDRITLNISTLNNKR